MTDIARGSHISLTEALTRAVDAYRREVFFSSLRTSVAATRADPKAWAEEESERDAWDVTLLDGLEDE